MFGPTLTHTGPPPSTLVHKGDRVFVLAPTWMEHPPGYFEFMAPPPKGDDAWDALPSAVRNQLKHLSSSMTSMGAPGPLNEDAAGHSAAGSAFGAGAGAGAGAGVGMGGRERSTGDSSEEEEYAGSVGQYNDNPIGVQERGGAGNGDMPAIPTPPPGSDHDMHLAVGHVESLDSMPSPARLTRPTTPPAPPLASAAVPVGPPPSSPTATATATGTNTWQPAPPQAPALPPGEPPQQAVTVAVAPPPAESDET